MTRSPSYLLPEDYAIDDMANLCLYPGQSVHVVQALEAIMEANGGALATQSFSTLVDFFYSLSGHLQVTMMLCVREDGEIQFRFPLSHVAAVRNEILEGPYRSIKGLLLYMFMRSTFNTRLVRDTDTWEINCTRWGFPKMPGNLWDRMGLPSLSAVYIGDNQCPDSLNLFKGWETRTSHSMSFFHEIPTYPDGCWSTNSEIMDLCATDRVRCVDMRSNLGREAAWNILKSIHCIT